MLVKSLNTLSRYIDPESIHKMTMLALKGSRFSQDVNSIPTLGRNIDWKNKIGLAAGFDKNGEFVNQLSKLGFGAIEVGTVTPAAQDGNLRPRIKKINTDQSILNWMGFPSEGMDKVYQNLLAYNGDAKIGINIGKNKDTDIDKAIIDYVDVAVKLKRFADYNVVNVSSPNTKGLRSLQNVGFLKELISEYDKNDIGKVFIKLSPEVNKQDLKGIVSLAQEQKISGIIGTNTTTDHSYGKGGLSGDRLKHKSYELIKSVCELSPDRNFDLIACGGISTKKDLSKYEDLNIDFFQVYSAFIYQGPKLIKQLLL